MSTQIIRLFRKLLKFAVFAVIGYLLLLIIITTWAPEPFKQNVYFNMDAYGYMHTRIKEVRNTENVDLLFLGSSHTYRGFDTRIFEAEGWKVFNLGSSAQSPVQTQALLKRYLDQLNPKLVIYEVYPGNLNTDGIESSVDLLSSDVVDKHSLALALKTPGLKVFNTLIPSIWFDLTGQKNKYVQHPIDGKDEYISGGYVEMELEHYRTVRNTTPREWQWKENQLLTFEQNLKLLNDSGIKTILVFAPIPPGHYRNYTNSAEYDRLMESYGSYLNFNHLIILNDSLHFYDSHHLNQEGVRLFNEEFIKILKAEYSN